ncbi:MAG: hypothetical protein IJN54_04425 [Lachnospiraceae bacterium]|nr:hypothetical protein [Lachnospiraceae bacterium]
MGRVSKEQVINKLLEYNEQGVVILGPKGRNEKKLRVYAYGGELGEIALSENGKYEVNTDRNYALNHIVDDEDSKTQLLRFMDEAEQEGADVRDRSEILCDDKYIECMLKATKHKGYKNSVYQGQKLKKERLIETTLILQQGKIKYEEGSLLVYDMEYAIPLPNKKIINKKGKEVAKISKPDFMVFDGKNIGMVELKYDADNMTGDNSLENHYDDFMHYIHMENDAYRWGIIKETIHRLTCLQEEGLIDKSWEKAITELKQWYDANKSGEFVTDRLWVGFYFVEGPHKERKRKPCRQYVEEEIKKQLSSIMKNKKYDTVVRYGYWNNDENVKLVLDKEIVLDEDNNISFEEL